MAAKSIFSLNEPLSILLIDLPGSFVYILNINDWILHFLPPDRVFVTGEYGPILRF
jgi:hypothetical protein